MCGITGFFSVDATSASSLRAMTDLLRHRGPDDEGYVLFGKEDRHPEICAGLDTPLDAGGATLPYAPTRNINECAEMGVTLALGHRRLAILDLSSMGHQPMCTPDKRYWISYNGEVYNYIELRQELESCGHRFVSHTDTEALLAAYVEWGVECLQRFNGMWAFAIYDAVKEELFIARDRFGIKPLYYMVTPSGTFCFASEIKSFTAVPEWSATLNHQAGYDYLAWGFSDQDESTMFSGVYQLRGGHYIILRKSDLKHMRSGKVPTVQWYTLRGKQFSGSYADATREFRDRFTDAVRLHMRSDVPVGSCLSGGLDSSSIVCVMNQLLNEQQSGSLQHSFSACTDEDRFDERKWIEEVIRHTGIESHSVFPSLEKLFLELPEMTWQQDEPFGSTSVYAQSCVFRLAANHNVKVMLDGQGADEMLGGYHAFFGPHFASLFRAGRMVKLWDEIKLTKRIHGYSEATASMHMANVLLPEMIKQPLRAFSGRDSMKPTWLNLKRLDARPGNPMGRFGHDIKTVNSLSHAQLTRNNLQRLLHWEDRNSMAHSIESRVPFLDYRLVEFVLGLPDDFKVSKGITKRVMRSGMSGILPDKIRDRYDKIGFATPEEVWVRKTDPGIFRKKMKQAIEVSDGIFRPKSLQMLEDVVSGKRPFTSTSWRIINFAEWLQVFSVKTR